MKLVLFYHSLVSDWNHGNAHFLRGIATELLARGHEVTIYEPRDGWSRAQLLREQGPAALNAFSQAYPRLQSRLYELGSLDLSVVLDGADVVIVHEWNDLELVSRVGRHHASHPGAVLLFHDTHHRSTTAPHELSAYPLSAYDGVLAFGEVIRERYVELGWASRAFTWHEAADIRVFHPCETITGKDAELVWIGNWGDDERADELRRFLFEPAASLGLATTIHGVRYPEAALTLLRRHGIQHAGWLPNHAVPRVFAKHRVTMHVPRRPYVRALPGIPTIRVFEALACGIPLVSAPWPDVEGLFRPGEDFLVADDGDAMRRRLAEILFDSERAEALVQSGLDRIHARHTCRHRVDELLAIVDEIGQPHAACAALQATGSPEVRP